MYDENVLPSGGTSKITSFATLPKYMALHRIFRHQQIETDHVQLPTVQHVCIQ